MQVRLLGMNDTLAYSIYLCAGILTWGLFGEIIGCCLTVFLENANMIKKMTFPRIFLPVIVVLTACVNFVIIFWTVGLDVFLDTMNVFFRYVEQFVEIVLIFWF